MTQKGLIDFEMVSAKLKITSKTSFTIAVKMINDETKLFEF